MPTTWNPSDISADLTLSNGNLTADTVSGPTKGVRSVASAASGKYYWEITLDAFSSAGGGFQGHGVATSGADLDTFGDTNEWIYRNSGDKRTGGSDSAYGSSYDTGDVIGVALDLNNDAIWFSKNGTWQNGATLPEIEAGTTTKAAFTGLTATLFALLQESVSNTATANFGQTSFAHTVPSGFAKLGGEGIAPRAVAVKEAIGPVTVTRGAVTTTPHGIAAPGAVGSISTVHQSVMSHSIASAQGAGAHSIGTVKTIAPASIKSAEAASLLRVAHVVNQALNIAPIASAEALGRLAGSTAPVLQTKRWVGKATAVKQVSTVTITAFDSATTYKVTIGGVEITQVGTTDANTTATNLKNALAASTHPYLTAITWTVSGNVVTGTAAIAGVPFAFTASVSGGAGTIYQDTPTPSTGPHDWSSAANWDPVGVPNSTDFVYFEDSAVNCCWGLDQSVVQLSALVIRQSYTGRIGLRHTVFATSIDGLSTAAKPEYRTDYLTIGWPKAEIGTPDSVADLAGSARLKLKNISGAAAVTIVHDTAESAPDGEEHLPAVRLLLNHANHDLYVRSAPGGVGVAVEKAGEMSTCGLVSVSDVSEASKVWIGPGVTLANYEQLGGSNVVQASGTIGTMRIEGGVLQLEGDYGVTTLTIEDGTVYDNHLKAGGNAVTTLNLNGGVLDFRQATQDRSIGTLNLSPGATLHADGAVMNFGARNLPPSLFSLGAN